MAAVIHAMERNTFTNSSRRKMRQKGQIPAVIYGKHHESRPIVVTETELTKVLRENGKNAMLTIEFAGENHKVLLRELQIDPLKGGLIHADFQIVDMDSEVDVAVSVVLKGEAKGVKEGGVLQQMLPEVEVRAKPAHLPSVIEINITNLGIDDVLYVKDIQKEGQYEILDDPNTVIATILQPQNDELDDVDGSDQKEQETEKGGTVE